MEYLKISGFQKSTIIAELESIRVGGPYIDRYGNIHKKGEAIFDPALHV
jgi:hypothetical protein